MTVCEKSPEQIIEELRQCQAGQQLVDMFLSNTDEKSLIAIRPTLFRNREFDGNGIFGNVKRAESHPLVMGIRAWGGRFGVVLVLASGKLSKITEAHYNFIVPSHPDYESGDTRGIGSPCDGGWEGSCGAQLIFTAESIYVPSSQLARKENLHTHPFDYDKKRPELNQRILNLQRTILTPVSQEEVIP